MKIERLIPLTNGRAVAILDNGTEKLVDLEPKENIKFNNNGIFKRYSEQEMSILLSNSDERIDEVISLLQGIECFLIGKFLNIHLENNKEAQNDLIKVFSLLDMTSSRIDDIKIYTSTVNNSIIKGKYNEKK